MQIPEWCRGKVGDGWMTGDGIELAEETASLLVSRGKWIYCNPRCGSNVVNCNPPNRIWWKKKKMKKKSFFSMPAAVMFVRKCENSRFSRLSTYGEFICSFFSFFFSRFCPVHFRWTDIFYLQSPLRIAAAQICWVSILECVCLCGEYRIAEHAQISMRCLSINSAENSHWQQIDLCGAVSGSEFIYFGTQSLAQTIHQRRPSFPLLCHLSAADRCSECVVCQTVFASLAKITQVAAGRGLSDAVMSWEENSSIWFCIRCHSWHLMRMIKCCFQWVRNWDSI